MVYLDSENEYDRINSGFKDAGVSFFPTAVPGETLYNVCARYHQRSGFARPAISSKVLFGFTHAGNLRDIPVGLTYLKSQVGDMLPDIETILKTMTVAGLYLPFLSEKRKEEFVAACSAPPGARAKYRLGLHASRVLAQHVLKFCPVCIDDDAEKVGFSYWHIEHQYPGIRVCLHHRTALFEVPDRDIESRGWALPKHFTSNVRPLSLHSSDTKWLLHVAAILRWIASHSNLSTDALRSLAVKQLLEHGAIQSSQSLNSMSLSAWFQRRCPSAAIQQFPEFAALKNGCWIRDLLLARRVDHPLRWALLLACLLSADELTCLNHMVKGLETDICGQSEFLFQVGPTPINRAPKRAYEVLQTGINLKGAWVELGVTRGVLLRWLDQDDTLRSCWEKAKRNLKLHHSRQALEALRKNQPTLSRAALLNSITAEYRWLERHDKEWLISRLPPLDQRHDRQLPLF
jgi:hypothetical protein